MVGVMASAKESRPVKRGKALGALLDAAEQLTNEQIRSLEASDDPKVRALVQAVKDWRGAVDGTEREASDARRAIEAAVAKEPSE